MHPWEKRLRDLWILLQRCHTTYMEPDLFRLSVNQFLQTSRTVTFIIQKNKESIPDYDAWYGAKQKEWGDDRLMTWAKDSRNQIEKEGDLELHSSLELSLFYSYFEEQDVKIKTGRAELLKAGTKRLVRFARQRFPSAVVKTSAIKVERKWVANSLPEWELLQALTYVYTTLYRTCENLAVRLGAKIEKSIPDPSDVHSGQSVARQVAYLKLSDMNLHYQHVTRMLRDDALIKAKFPTESWTPLRDLVGKAKTFDSISEAMSEMAKQSFEFFGYHVPMLFMYDDEMNIVDSITTMFRDSVDKFIFWRTIADRVVATKAKLITCTGEAWIRSNKTPIPYDISKAPIIGERLFFIALSDKGACKQMSWEIIRSSDDEKPTLGEIGKFESEHSRPIPNYVAPIFKAWAIPYPDNFNEVLGRDERMAQ